MNNMQLSTNVSEDKVIAACTHIFALIATSFLMNLIVPIVVLCVSKSPFVKDQAKEALNFQISLVIWAIICAVLCLVFIGIPMLFVLAFAAVILPIVATVTVLGGNAYRYPLIFRFVQ